MFLPIRDDNPTQIWPVMTVSLIFINVLVFLYQLTLGPEEGQIFVYQFGAIPAAVLGNQSLPSDMIAIPATMSVLTSMFLHGGFMHLIGNMLYLWIFGNNVEEAMGHIRFLIFYLVTGVVASMTHFLMDVDSTIPTIGASGAISGVLGAYILLYPHAQVYVFVFIVIIIRMLYIPAGIVLGFYFLLQVFQGASTMGQEGGGVAWFAHIGGFVAGMILVGVFKKRGVRFLNPPHYHARRVERFHLS
jgi:membrane associated rhomboid family serine protease